MTQGKTLLRGLSLSFCIRDIIEGRVEADDVAEIRAGTYIATEEDLEDVIRSYQRLYWGADPERAAQLVREFFAEGIVVQPRLHGEPAHLRPREVWEEYIP